MNEAISGIQWSILAEHWSLICFLLVTSVLLSLLGMDLRRGARTAAKDKLPERYLSRYRDENGMPIYYDANTDPSDLAAHRVIARMYRSGGVKSSGQSHPISR